MKTLDLPAAAALCKMHPNTLRELAVARRPTHHHQRESNMKLYKTTYNTDGIINSTWSGSADEASKGRTALKAAHPGCKPTTEQHDVSTAKAGLLAWLNEHVV